MMPNLLKSSICHSEQRAEQRADQSGKRPLRFFFCTDSGSHFLSAQLAGAAGAKMEKLLPEPISCGQIRLSAHTAAGGKPLQAQKSGQGRQRLIQGFCQLFRGSCRAQGDGPGVLSPTDGQYGGLLLGKLPHGFLRIVIFRIECGQNQLHLEGFAGNRGGDHGECIPISVQYAVVPIQPQSRSLGHQFILIGQFITHFSRSFRCCAKIVTV